MRYVSQSEAHDCGVAALAMATGADYRDLRTAFADRLDAAQGLTSFHIEEWCFRNGWAWQRIHATHQLGGVNLAREAWPPEPFAPSHICQVIARGCYHFVAMGPSGVVLDPAFLNCRRLTHPDYSEICFVMGLWPVGGGG